MAARKMTVKDRPVQRLKPGIWRNISAADPKVAASAADIHLIGWSADPDTRRLLPGDIAFAHGARPRSDRSWPNPTPLRKNR